MLTPAVTFEEIEFGSEDFQKECKLRNEVLRLPLGLNLFNEDLSREAHQRHFGLFDQYRNLIACAVAINLARGETKIRQMVVSEMHRGNGYGRTILQSLERDLAQRGTMYFFMHARMTAVGFYERLGYAKIGHQFMEVGIPHVKMEKYFQPTVW
jgi:predicted GNAT family N-acyltransferase